MNWFYVNVIQPPWIFLVSPITRSAGEQPSRQSPTLSLKHYGTPGVSPASARVNPKLKLQP